MDYKSGQTVRLQTGSLAIIDFIQELPNGNYAVKFRSTPKLFELDKNGKTTEVGSNLTIMGLVEDKNPTLVSIVIPVSHLENFRYRRLICACFGLKDRELPRFYESIFYNVKDEKITIICNTDQFTRFIFERNERGFKNWIKDLEMKIIKSFKHEVMTYFVA